MRNQTWLERVIVAFKNLDGKAKYQDLYSEIERIAVLEKRHLTSQWQATVRRTIEDHSSDSENFKSSDLFYKIGAGYWGMRNYQTDINTSKINGNIFFSDTDLFIDGITKERLISLKIRNQKLILNRKIEDNFTCQSCGFYYNNKIVECHHLIPISNSETIYNSTDDLVTLCPNCHALAHSLYTLDEAYQNRDILLKKLKETIKKIQGEND